MFYPWKMTAVRSTNASASLLFAGLFVLLLFIHAGQALVCIACHETTCHNTSLWKRIPDCEKDYGEDTGVCFKKVLLLDGVKVIRKGCVAAKSLPGQSPNFTFDCGSLTNPKSVFCGTCNDKDECNSGYLSHSSYTLIMVFVFFSFVFE